MKLYLSSFKFGNKTEDLISMVGKNKKTAVISNALDFSTELERKAASTQKEIDGLRDLGFDAEELDLRHYFSNRLKLDEDLKKYGLIWVKGGIGFVLRKAYEQSGFGTWLLKQKGNSDFVYGGYSAGICVLTPSLKGLELVDDVNVQAEGYNNETIWEGIGLLNYCIAPHFRSDHPESELVEKYVEYLIKNKMLFKVLQDGEVIIDEI